MPNALEIPLPMRFIFLLLTPKNSSFIDGHEVGRSFSALMSNRKFHNVCYGIEGRKELLTAINDFLDSSVVLPPGDWDSKNLLSMDEINELRNRKRGRKSKDMSISSVSEGTVYGLGQKILKVSKFQKQIFLFTFEPKNERNYFFISALASKKGSNQNSEGTLLY